MKKQALFQQKSYTCDVGGVHSPKGGTIFCHFTNLPLNHLKISLDTIPFVSRAVFLKSKVT